MFLPPNLAVSTTVARASLPSWGYHRGAPILLGLVIVSSVASLGSTSGWRTVGNKRRCQGVPGGGGIGDPMGGSGERK
jgi:hypothetical protein